MFAALFAALTIATAPAVGVNTHPWGGMCPLPENAGAVVRIDHHLDWGAEMNFPACMEKVRASGRTPLVTVLGETRPAEYAAAMADLARRYPGTAWEIWNEQNHPRFWTGSVAEYVTLLRAASQAIRAADPTATVVLGGLGFCDAPWLAQAYRLGLRGLVDVVAVHPYESIADWPAKFYGVRRVMTRWSDPVPVWVTEFGWRGVDQPAAFGYALPALPWYVEAVIWYDLAGLGE